MEGEFQHSEVCDHDFIAGLGQHHLLVRDQLHPDILMIVARGQHPLPILEHDNSMPIGCRKLPTILHIDGHPLSNQIVISYPISGYPIVQFILLVHKQLQVQQIESPLFSIQTLPRYIFRKI